MFREFRYARDSECQTTGSTECKGTVISAKSQSRPDHQIPARFTAWQEILAAEGISEEEAVADFKRWRAKQKR